MHTCIHIYTYTFLQIYTYINKHIHMYTHSYYTNKCVLTYKQTYIRNNYITT